MSALPPENSANVVVKVWLGRSILPVPIKAPKLEVYELVTGPVEVENRGE
jgi:hypothetical protein